MTTPNKIYNESEFPKPQIKWKLSKDEVWNQCFESLPETEKVHKKIKLNKFWKVAMVASVAVLIGFTFFANLYTTKVVCPIADKMVAQLPDGSTVNLNADSYIEFKPYWWFVEREVKMNGEAFFKVKKGAKFQVQTPQGTVEVLGTSFNVWARKKNFKVACITGKVRVNSHKQTLVLHPKQTVSLKAKKLKRSSIKNENASIGWIKNKFEFTNKPLKHVLEEIERQYGVKINNKSIGRKFYSGNFSSTLALDSVLKLISTPMEIKIVKSEKKSYYIVKKK